MRTQKKLLKLWEKMTDILFPPSQRTVAVRRLSQHDLQTLPRSRQRLEGSRYGVFNYNHQTVQKIVHAAKYDGSRYAARLMGALMHNDLLDICTRERIITSNIALLPVPLSPERLQERGFNQSLRIAKSLQEHAPAGHFTVKAALEKTRSTPNQTSLTKPKRKQNLANAFRLKPNSNIANDIVIIIDDVTTTGTTFRETKRVVETGHPETVLAVAFAH